MSYPQAKQERKRLSVNFPNAQCYYNASNQQYFVSFLKAELFTNSIFIIKVENN